MSSGQEPAQQRRTASLVHLKAGVGSRMQLIIERFGRESRYGTFLIGFVSNEFLIVRTPVDAGLPLRIETGEPLKALLFTGTEIASFQTTVLRQFGAPMVYWHLDYPRVVEAFALRSAPRFVVDLPVAVGGVGEEPIEARLVDLSPRGAQLVATRMLGERETRISLRFEVTPDAGTAPVRIEVGATIKSAKLLAPREGEAPKHAHGVAFDELPAEHAELLRMLDGRNSRN